MIVFSHLQKMSVFSFGLKEFSDETHTLSAEKWRIAD